MKKLALSLFLLAAPLGTPLGVTCAPGILPSGAIVTARTAVTSFTIEVPGTTTGYTCGFYTIF